MVSGNVAVYYRQSDLTFQVPLSIVCNDPDIDIIILAFVIRFFNPAGWPTLNLGSLCSSPTAAQLQAGAAGLLVCTSNSFDIQIEQ
jgi:chitinase